MERVDTLRELLERKLISPDDQVRPPGERGTISVAEAIEVYADGGRATRGRPSADPWRAWDTDEAVEVDDLVDRLLGGPDDTADDAPSPSRRLAAAAASLAVPPSIDPDAGADDEVQSMPEESIEYLAGELGPAIDEPPPPAAPPPRSPAPVLDQPPPSSPPAGGSPSLVGFGALAMPRPTPESPSDPGDDATAEGDGRTFGFVEYVQQKRAATTPLELHEDRAPLVFGADERRHPFGFWPAVISVLIAIGALAIYGVIRSGAERAYPTESEVRDRLRGGEVGLPVSPADADAPADVAFLPDEGDSVRHENRLRSEIPVPVRAFRNVDTFKDALFMDLANSAIRVREIRVEALVVAPMPDEHRQRPEEVNLELWLTADDESDGHDAMFKSALILGHYGSVAHVRLQELVFHLVYDGDIGLTYLTRGKSAVAFYERELDMEAFLRGMDRVSDGDYIDDPS